MSKEDKEIIIEKLSDSLSKDKISEIVEKEWKVVELPLDEELEIEENSSPMARSNPNSRRNLAQYNEKRSEEGKRRSLENLRNRKQVDAGVTEEEVLEIKDRINIKFPELIPVDDLFEEKDRRVYYKAIDTYLKDFENEELSVLDLDDIQTLALNKVWILKLMGLAHSKPKDILEISGSIDRYKRDNIKIKENLATRRKDRIDPKIKSSVSILDLAESFDEAARKKKLTRYEQDKEDRIIYKKKQEKLLKDDE
jgi:hypothetical protein